MAGVEKCREQHLSQQATGLRKRRQNAHSAVHHSAPHPPAHGHQGCCSAGIPKTRTSFREDKIRAADETPWLAFAAGGFAGGNSFASKNSYAPILNITVPGAAQRRPSCA